MNEDSRYFGGTVDNARPMALRLSFKRKEKDVVRWPDAILLRRSTSTNFQYINCQQISGCPVIFSHQDHQHEAYI